MRSLARVVLCGVLAIGCDRGGEGEPAGTPPPQVDPMEPIRQQAGPVPDLEIRIAPEVRAWEIRDDRWALEATITLTNRGDAPMELRTGRLRLRDQSRPLRTTVRGFERRTRLAPDESIQLEVTASQHPPERGRPTVLRADYGTTLGMTPAVSAPVTAVPTTGLVATFGDAQPPHRQHAPHVHGRGSPPKWQVRLAMDLHNPTDRLVRMPQGQLTAVREDGTESYWGDHAGVSIDDRWFEPGARRRATVTLMFDDSPEAPSRITLTYASGPPQRLDLPPPVARPPDLAEGL